MSRASRRDHQRVARRPPAPASHKGSCACDGRAVKQESSAALSAAGSSYAPKPEVTCQRLAMKPSSPSLKPATGKHQRQRHIMVVQYQRTPQTAQPIVSRPRADSAHAGACSGLPRRLGERPLPAAIAERQALRPRTPRCNCSQAARIGELDPGIAHIHRRHVHADIDDCRHARQRATESRPIAASEEIRTSAVSFGRAGRNRSTDARFHIPLCVVTAVGCGRLTRWSCGSHSLLRPLAHAHVLTTRATRPRR